MPRPGHSAGRGLLAYGLGAAASLFPVGCGLAAQASLLLFASGGHAEAQDAAVASPFDGWDGVTAFLPDPKSATTPPPLSLAGDEALLATWEVLDDICDPVLDLEDREVPALACQNAGYLPGYAKQKWCLDRSIRFHGDYRVDFDGSGREQAMLVYEGCEGTVGMWGGAVFVARGERGWEIREHRRHFNPSDCVPFERSDGSMTLACTMYYGRMGVARDYLSVVGIEGWDDAPEYLQDDVMHGCSSTPGFEGDPLPSEEHVYAYEATWRRFEGFEQRQEEDGVHLTVKVGYALFTVTSSLTDPVCRLVYPDRPESWDFRYIENPSLIEALVEVEHLRLDYLDDGERLVPTFETSRLLERIGSSGRGALGLLGGTVELEEGG